MALSPDANPQPAALPSPLACSVPLQKVATTTQDPISNLPSELIEEIARNLTSVDLRALRRTNKMISAAVINPFGKAHFKTREHLYTVRSLTALVHITSDVTLGRFVKKVSLGSGRLRKRGVRLRPNHQIQIHEQLKLDQELAVKLLAEAFENIRRNKGHVTLGVFTNEGLLDVAAWQRGSKWYNFFRKGWGVENRMRLDGDHSVVDNVFSTVKALTSAVRATAYPVETFTINSDRAGKIKTPHDALTLFTNLDVSLPNLNHARLNDSEDWNLNFPRTVNLESLKLSVPETFNFDRSIFETGGMGMVPWDVCPLWPSSTFTRLREVHLSGLRTPLQETLTFLGKIKSSLRLLTISRHKMAEHETWPILLTWLMENLNLHQFNLGELFFERGWEVSQWGHLSRNVQFQDDIHVLEGSRIIRQGLQSLIHAFEDADGSVGLGRGWVEVYTESFPRKTVQYEEWPVDDWTNPSW